MKESLLYRPDNRLSEQTLQRRRAGISVLTFLRTIKCIFIFTSLSDPRGETVGRSHNALFSSAHRVHLLYATFYWQDKRVNPHFKQMTHEGRLIQTQVLHLCNHEQFVCGRDKVVHFSCMQICDVSSCGVANNIRVGYWPWRKAALTKCIHGALKGFESTCQWWALCSSTWGDVHICKKQAPVWLCQEDVFKQPMKSLTDVLSLTCVQWMQIPRMFDLGPTAPLPVQQQSLHGRESSCFPSC